MIVDLVDKLIDRTIQLLTYRKQMRTVLLETYVAPVFAEFEHLHSAYLESLTRYRDFIQTSKDANWISSLQSTLEKDNLFTANCRSKVLRLAEAEHDEILGPFVKGISEYLLGPDLSTAWVRWRSPIRLSDGEKACSARLDGLSRRGGSWS